MNLSAALKAELEKSNPQIHRSVSFAFADEIFRISDVGLCSATLGFFEPFVVTFGSMDHPGGDRQCSLQRSRWTGLTFIDIDRGWQTRAMLFRLKGRIATFTLGSPNVDPADWFSVDWAIEAWEYPEEGLVAVSFIPPFYDVLCAPLPLVPIAADAFPTAPKESRGLYPPIGPYGQHDSFGIGTVDGSIKPVLVDPANHIYLVGQAGAIEKVLHAYADGVRLVFTAWDQLTVPIKGIAYVLVQFDANQAAKEVTLDVRGFGVEGFTPGSAAIDRPVAVFRHLLANSIYVQTLDALSTENDWTAESLIPVAPVYFDETEEHLERRTATGARAGLYISASQTQVEGSTLVDQFCETEQVQPFFTVANLLAVRADSMDHEGYLGDPVWLQRRLDELDTGPLFPADPAEDVVGTVVVKANIVEAYGTVPDELEVNAQPPPNGTSGVYDRRVNSASDTINSVFGEAFL